MRLSNTTKRLIIEDPELEGGVAKKIGKSPWTVRRWLKADNIGLTSVGVLEFLSEKTGLTQEELLEKEATTA